MHLEDEWVIDTGCSYHMTHKRSWFCDLNEDVGGFVRMGNKTVARVRGVGSIKIINEEGHTVLLSNVRYIPDIDRNLMSLGTVENEGYSFESHNGVLSIKKDDQMVNWKHNSVVETSDG